MEPWMPPPMRWYVAERGASVTQSRASASTSEVNRGSNPAFSSQARMAKLNASLAGGRRLRGIDAGAHLRLGGPSRVDHDLEVVARDRDRLQEDRRHLHAL